MRLTASRADYQNGFRKHYHAYQSWKSTGHDNSRRLILTYCVECGLKYLYLEKLRENGILNEARMEPDMRDTLFSHDLKKLYFSLKPSAEGIFPFSPIITDHGETVELISFHQLCRYCIKADKNTAHLPGEYEVKLVHMMNWIYEQGV